MVIIHKPNTDIVAMQTHNNFLHDARLHSTRYQHRDSLFGTNRSRPLPGRKTPSAERWKMLVFVMALFVGGLKPEAKPSCPTVSPHPSRRCGASPTKTLLVLSREDQSIFLGHRVGAVGMKSIRMVNYLLTEPPWVHCPTRSQAVTSPARAVLYGCGPRVQALPHTIGGFVLLIVHGRHQPFGE